MVFIGLREDHSISFACAACVGVSCHVSPLHLHTHASSFQPPNTHIFCHVFLYIYTHMLHHFNHQTPTIPTHVCVFPLPMCVCFSFAFADTCSSLFQPTIHPFSAHVCVFPLPMCCLSLFISQICLALF